MVTDEFIELQKIIAGRRSISWAKMNGRVIPDENIEQVLALAHWAPTHGRTEPWRFFVYKGDALARFGKAHADLYWQHTAEDKRMQATYDKLLHNADKTSHLVIAVMKRGENAKIPQLEEIAAASAAVQNILLGATALGIASFWSTGGMAHSHALKEHLHLQSEDIVLGLIYFGYTDEPVSAGKRNTEMNEKVKWL
jgi:nitroreductase